MLTKVATVTHGWRFGLSLALAGLFLCGQLRAAPSSDWASVERLNAGRTVSVVRSGGDVVNGRVESVSGEAIRLATSTGAVEVPRAVVAEVRKRRSRLVRVAQIGALGAGVGIGIAAGLLAATGGSDETAAIVVTGAAIGGGAGAAVGAALPNGATVYRRP